MSAPQSPFKQTTFNLSPVRPQGVNRPAAGKAAGGAMVAGRRYRDGARPAMGSHNPQAVLSSFQFLPKFRQHLPCK
ncbi:hypothetical protein ACLOJK_036742 [Asimina triloba]